MIYTSSFWASGASGAPAVTDGVTPTIRRYRYIHRHGWLLPLVTLGRMLWR